MASTLIFADGVRLTTRDELPGPPDRREALWARVDGANIHPGFTLKAVQDAAFRYYAEANVHAHEVWPAFCDLSKALLGERASLLMAFKDEEPAPVVEAPVEAILAAMEPHQDQFAHDGYVQFGLVAQTHTGLAEVFVTPTKHFRIWFSDEREFAARMKAHDLMRAEQLQFIDEFPRVTTRLPDDRALRVDVLQSEVLRRLA
jgi:hypothetical protein